MLRRTHIDWSASDGANGKAVARRDARTSRDDKAERIFFYFHDRATTKEGQTELRTKDGVRKKEREREKGEG